MKLVYYTLIIGLISTFGPLHCQCQCNCAEGYFECGDGSCIRESWLCDGTYDCGDMSDEPEICTPCPTGYWECANGNCIRAPWICDGRNDCGDMSDEMDPETGACPLCPDSVFQCKNGRCIEKGYVCDWMNTCGDNSDEPENPDDCPPCGFRQFRCNDGRCITERYVCDGSNDCDDWSDESVDVCPCGDGEMPCSTSPSEDPTQPGSCIPADRICDPEGVWDCPDGSDEVNCTIASGKHINHDHIKKNVIHHSVRKSDTNEHKLEK